MKKLVAALLLFAVSACGQQPLAEDPDPSEDTGGSPGQGSGGTKGSGGSGGAKGGKGGSGGSGGITSTGGSPASSGGSIGTGGSPDPGTGGSSSAPDASADVTEPADTNSMPPPGAGGYSICPRCRPLFDGKDLDQWVQGAAGAWVIKGGAMASTGKANDIWTKEDFGNYRIFFTLRQISGNHQPGTLYFGDRNGDKPVRGLAGIQIQPPNGYTWDYRPGKNNSGAGLFMKLPAPKLDVKQWNQCEVLVKNTGEMRFGCCPAGPTPCKATESLRFKDPAAANKKSPFGIQMHNGGLFDEYKDIWIETDPTVDDLLSTK